MALKEWCVYSNTSLQDMNLSLTTYPLQRGEGSVDQFEDDVGESSPHGLFLLHPPSNLRSSTEDITVECVAPSKGLSEKSLT
jgi:hypothetical protein